MGQVTYTNLVWTRVFRLDPYSGHSDRCYEIKNPPKNNNKKCVAKSKHIIQESGGTLW